MACWYDYIHEKCWAWSVKIASTFSTRRLIRENAKARDSGTVNFNITARLKISSDDYDNFRLSQW